MEIFLLIVLAVVALKIIPWASKTKQKRPNYYKNEDLYSNAWKRIAGELPELKRTRPIDWGRLFQSPSESRRDYYRNVYLKSDEWKRKRYVVLKRDNWRCVHCGAPATQVHHKKYLRKKIGKEPIKWLESVCKNCHDSLHR